MPVTAIFLHTLGLVHNFSEQKSVIIFQKICVKAYSHLEAASKFKL